MLFDYLRSVATLPCSSCTFCFLASSNCFSLSIVFLESCSSLMLNISNSFSMEAIMVFCSALSTIIIAKFISQIRKKRSSQTCVHSDLSQLVCNNCPFLCVQIILYFQQILHLNMAPATFLVSDKPEFLEKSTNSFHTSTPCRPVFQLPASLHARKCQNHLCISVLQLNKPIFLWKKISIPMIW